MSPISYKKKAKTFRGVIPSIQVDNFEDHYVLVFDLVSMQDATQICRIPELVVEPLRLELNFIFPLEYVTELAVLGEQRSFVAVEKFGDVGKNI